ncbi:two-component histidine kinase [Weissella oryzae SG25]|uniref:histidine kinase n=1 Tax=Weissella oryzae (strain DSM 25784 / JCM 18191 / LMG 30913 / SG25) TaxID=1329250 RepID=A0A069CRX8_WEIOS|nr:sensor histidine kinase [Weissella oryzae]GAK30137.1 two-component histidine kinase [Weissella oryzae SG25]
MPLFKYLKAQYALIITFCLVALFLPLSLLLWHVPLFAAINSGTTVGLLALIYLSWHFLTWRKQERFTDKLLEENHQLSTQLSEQIKNEQAFNDIIRVWSHQMKVPMTAIDMMTQTKLDGQELQNQLFYLNYYLNLLLEYQRIINLSSDFRFEEVSVKSSAVKIIKKYRTFFIQKGLTITIHADPDWQLITDRRWFELALEQVINNAIKYTKTGGITIDIQTGQIKISDTGIGILPEDLPRLFEHGFTGFNGRIQDKSSGLGLYLSHLILEKLTLQISISSTIDVGSQVTIKK